MAEMVQHFQYYRGLVFFTCFIITIGLQIWIPFEKIRANEILRNWKTNFFLGIFNSVFISLVVGRDVCLLALKIELSGKSFLVNLLSNQTLQIAASVIVLDFVSYAWHRANHRFRILWRFHATHHSDNIIDSSSSVRFHPFEVGLSIGVRIIVVSILGIPVVALLTFEAIYIFFNLLEHSWIRLPHWIDSVFGRIFVTPAMHRWHHSTVVNQSNSNYGTIFSIWDRMFGTYQNSVLDTEFTVGLPGYDKKMFGILKSFLIPFREGKR